MAGRWPGEWTRGRRLAPARLSGRSGSAGSVVWIATSAITTLRGNDLHAMELRRHPAHDVRLLLLVPVHLDVHRGLRRHLPPRRHRWRREGRMDLPDRHPAIPRRPHLSHRTAEDDRTGQANDRGAAGDPEARDRLLGLG